mgnify:CR=1 FL=1
MQQGFEQHGLAGAGIIGSSGAAGDDVILEGIGPSAIDKRPRRGRLDVDELGGAADRGVLGVDHLDGLAAQVAADHGRGVGAVVPQAQQGATHRVAAGQGSQLLEGGRPAIAHSGLKLRADRLNTRLP